jgi:Carboxypeptidase regulatory-like domain/TonB dependent receptor
MSKAAPRLLALFLALVGWSSHSFGQTPTGTILGSVHDSSGAVVAGARISVHERDTKLERSVTTNSEGYYEIPLLPPGQYELDVEFTGFKRLSRGNLTLSTNQRMEVTVALTPGDLAETVQVSGDSVLLETTTSSVGQVVDNKKIVDLPLSNRNLLQLQTLVAGVNDFGSTVAPATSGSVAFGRWTANGGMTNTNEFMLDGATAILGNLNAASIIPTIDAIQEFKIATNAMAAEYGRTGGAVINATYKSGTNNVHGTVYEFWKNRVLNANSWLNNRNNQPKDFTNVNVFGYSVGGPVYIPKVFNGRNKLFFFTNYEGYRDVTPARNLLTVPTAQQRTGDFSQLKTQAGAPISIYDPLTSVPVAGSPGQYTRMPFPGNMIPANRIDPVAAKMMGYYPLPNVTPSNLNTNTQNYLSLASAYNTQTEWSVKGDYNVSERLRIFSRYSQSFQGGGAANYFGNSPNCTECLKAGNPAGSYSPRGGGSDLFIYPKNVVVGLTYTISPNTLLDLRYSLNRQLLSRLPQSGGFDLTSIGFSSQFANSVYYPVFPPVSIQNYQGLGTASNGDFLRRGDTTHATQGSVTFLRGKHTIKTGGDFRMFRYADIQASNITPAFSFDQTWTQQNPFATSGTAGWSLASFLLGTPSSGIFSYPPSVAIQWFYTAGYIQDDWRVTSRLTLNLGLRYDVETPFTERYNRTSTLNPTLSTVATSRYPAALGGLQFVDKDISSRYRHGVDFNDFGPRVGAAYKITDSLVARAAYGIFYQPTMVYGYGGSSYGTQGFQGDTSLVASTDGGLTPATYLRNPFPGGFNPPTGSSLGSATFLGQTIQSEVRDAVVPYIQQYNAGFQYQFKSYLMDIGYVGSHGVHQVVTRPADQLLPQYYALGAQLNQQVPNPFYGLITSGPLANQTISQGQLLRPFPQYQDVSNTYQTSGNMNYNSLQTKIERRFSNGISFLANYTWSKNIGNVGERYWSGNAVQNQYDLTLERALSPLDIPHRLTFVYLYELPFGKGKRYGNSVNGPLNLLIGGWQINGSTTFQSGTPLSVVNSVNQLGFGAAGSRPNNVGRSAVLPDDQRTPQRWFDTSAFTAAAPYTFGNVGPYSPDLRGPKTNVWNISGFKNTVIKERLNVEFRAEFYNAFNHPIWAAPGTTFGSSTFGVVAQKNNFRSGQLALKLIF